ncbi:hypothetical protein [Cupriavidus pinatubonensis]|uniref:Uncharacterized protein n=1 Tax=Cupriavidus pinatubonensis TaxID=248026 RepID=A0ABM8XF69_9BURK|nr:hypothetical protein [Cupriavidus pinatubonensis]CAG9178780.1 hypothetical protein LMG23994_03998 [Cupriavidus pinatubonensis]
MLDSEREMHDLELADRHIQDGRERVRRQIALIRTLRDDGHDISQACRLLTALRDAVDVGRRHRALIIETLIDLARRRQSRASYPRQGFSSDRGGDMGGEYPPSTGFGDQAI